MSFFGNKEAARERRSRGKRKRNGGGILSLWIEVFAFLVLAFLLYVLASIFSLRTGAWGEQIRFSLLRNWGGAVIIPVLFGGYLCVSYLLKTGAKGIIRQFLGTALLFFCSALLFGLFRMAAVFQGVAVLSPGYLGDGLAIFFTRNIGSLGTLLLGAAFLVLSASLYGFFQPAAVIRKVSLLVKTISSEKWKRMPFPEDEAPQPSPVPAEEDSVPQVLPDGNHPPRQWSFSSQAEQEEPAAEQEPGGNTIPGSGAAEEAVPLVQEETEDLAGDDDDFFLRKRGRETEASFPEPVAENLPGPSAGGEERPAYEEEAEAVDEGEEEKDPHALPEIEFNELEGTEKKVRGAAFPPPLDLI
jgi:hypothetical protein